MSAFASAALPSVAHGWTSEDGGGSRFWEVPREIWIRRAATGEEARITYFAQGQLLEDGYQQACRLLRDVSLERRVAAMVRRGQRPPAGWYTAAWISPVLLDVLYALSGWLRFHRVDQPLVLTSAFRHAATNAMTEGAAKDSHHLRGGAADVVVPGIAPESIAKFGAWLRGGGVGFYPAKGFVHVDDGRLRSWRG